MEVSNPWGYPKSSMSLDHFSIETHNDLGILYFKKPPNRKVAPNILTLHVIVSSVRDSLSLLNRHLGVQMTLGTACAADSMAYHDTWGPTNFLLAKDI